MKSAHSRRSLFWVLIGKSELQSAIWAENYSQPEIATHRYQTISRPQKQHQRPANKGEDRNLPAVSTPLQTR
jgi:hypothetical protein